jgi:uncharacterized protein YcbK (DUF882 family)
MSLEVDPKYTLTRDAAFALVPDLVRLAESKPMDMDLWEKVNAIEVASRKGQAVIVAIKDYADPAKNCYVRAKISSVNHTDFRAVDGPVIRVKAGNLSWRVDGSDHFLPVTN